MMSVEKGDEGPEASRYREFRWFAVRFGCALALLPLVSLILKHPERIGLRVGVVAHLLAAALLLLYPLSMALGCFRRWQPVLLYGGLAGAEAMVILWLDGHPEAFLGSLYAFPFFLVFAPVLGLAHGFRTHLVGVLILTALPVAGDLLLGIRGFPIRTYLTAVMPTGFLSLYASLLTDRLIRQGYEDRMAVLRLALRDALTGAYNRHAFMPMAEELLALARRTMGPVSALMVDVDHFKKVNDTHGHGVGDDVLVVVAEAIRGALRETDLLARFGGEEFVVLMPESPATGALEGAERVRMAVEARRVALEGGGELTVTVSVGAATWRGGEERLEALLGRADAALYRAKHGGRNQVVLDPPA